MSWPVASLADVATINPRVQKDQKLPDNVAFLPMAAVSEEGGVVGAELRPLEEVRKGFTYFERGDVLLAKITPCFENGKATFLDRLETQVGFGSTEFHVIRPDEKQLDGKFLFYLLWNAKFRHEGGRNMTGSAGQRRVPTNFLERYTFLLPPLATQNHIARVLEQADQLRQQAQQMESELNQLAQSLFLEMFGDPVTNPKKWPLCQLSNIASVQLGKMLSEKAKTGVSPKKYLRNANVRWRNIEFDDLLEMDFSEREMKKFELQYGDLLVCEGGEVGRCAIWRNQLSDCYYQKALHRVRVKESTVTPEYLQEYFYWMATLGGLTSSVSEVTFSHLTAERLNALEVPVPPHKLQEQYTNKVALIEKQRQLVMKLCQKYEDTFNSLMQRAFNGELTAPERKAA